MVPYGTSLVGARTLPAHMPTHMRTLKSVALASQRAAPYNIIACCTVGKMAKLVLTRMTTSLPFVSTSVSTDPSTDPSIPYPIHGPNTYGMGSPELITQAPRYTAYLRIGIFPVFLAFSFFRGAAIGAGVYRRGLDGNAADAQALERGALYKLFAEIGWDIAQGRAAAFL